MSSEKQSETETRDDVSASKILAFHKLQSKFSFGSTNFSPRRLDRLISALKEKGMRFVSIDSAITNPHKDTVAISFDDGYEHLRDSLPELIEKHQLQPTVFIPTAYIGLPNRWDYSYLFQECRHLGNNAIRELADLGVEVGSHGHSHHPLIRLSDERIRNELTSSRKKLEDITGRSVSKISYPFGRVNDRVITAAVEAGYSNGFTMDFPTASDNPLAIGRLPIYGYDTPLTIRQKISGGMLYAVEKNKAMLTNRLSAGTGIYRWLTGR